MDSLGPIQLAIRRGEAPSEFSQKELDDWCREALARGCCYGYVRTFSAVFRRALVKFDLADKFPLLSCVSKDNRYAVRIDNFPPVLQDEVRQLLRWKTDPYAEGRPRKGRLREVTAKGLQTHIERLYGFVTRVQGRNAVNSLSQLVRKDSIVAFLNWSFNERKVRTSGIVTWLGSLCAAMRWNPAYKNLDLSWFRPLLSQVPPEPESEKKERKARKYLPYGDVAEIPRLIRRDREAATDAAPRRVAVAARDELIMSWLVTIPWRQRNIRECQLGHNLFKAKLSPFDTIARPRWVRERLLANPDEEFWQFHFREKETKTGGEVRSVLPRRLVTLLEEYLTQYRPTLLRGKDPGTLFLTQLGRRFSDHTLADVVSTLTLRYKNRRVTPHIFRDIVAYWWLELHPQDYLTLSKLLWHRDINTTIRIYGSRFDESHGVMRVEEWLDELESHDQRRNSTGSTATDVDLDGQATDEKSSVGNHNPVKISSSDYKRKYEEQSRISDQLTQRIRQLEKQLGQAIFEPQPEAARSRTSGSRGTRFRRVGR